jgi:hypothetical protein
MEESISALSSLSAKLANTKISDAWLWKKDEIEAAYSVIVEFEKEFPKIAKELQLENSIVKKINANAIGLQKALEACIKAPMLDESQQANMAAKLNGAVSNLHTAANFEIKQAKAMLSRRNFLKTTVKAAAVVAAASMMPSKLMAMVPGDFEIEIRLTPFKEYNPKAQRGFLSLFSSIVDIPDPMLFRFLNKPYKTFELKRMDQYTSKIVESDSVKNVFLSNPSEFRENVLKTAKELGYNDVSNLGVKEALLLCGKIVAKRLEYNMKMIEGENLPEDPDEKYRLLFMMALKGIDPRNPESRRVDAMPTDKLFSEGLGVCRNYATVNQAVFDVVKSENSNLNNTYMRHFEADSISHVLSLSHAWDLVTTAYEEGNKIVLDMTFVDPTWLDTRIKNYDNKGKISEGSEEEFYEAFDDAHFWIDKILAYEWVAVVYDTLADQLRLFHGYEISDKQIAHYKSVAFDKRLDLCRRMLNIAQKNPKVFKNIELLLGQSIMRCIELMVDKDAIIFMTLDTKIDKTELMKEQYAELEKLINDIEAVIPGYSKMAKVPYTIIKTLKDGSTLVADIPHRLNEIMEVVRKMLSEPNNILKLK